MGPAPLIAILALLSGDGPYYTPDSIANSAASIAGYYAPNTFITIYGSNLAYTTRAMTTDDIHGGILPTALIDTGVRVLLNSIAADIYYVSPTQVNLLVPTLLIAGPAVLQLEVDGLAGPPVTITLGDSAPSLFQIDATTVLATHADGSVITSSSTAHAGEVIVLYATGLGPTVPPAIPNQLPQTAALIAAMREFQVMLNGVAVDPSRILYAGVTPGYAGLFQINLRLPDDAPQNPEIEIGFAGRMSPSGRYLPVQ